TTSRGAMADIPATRPTLLVRLRGGNGPWRFLPPAMRRGRHERASATPWLVERPAQPLGAMAGPRTDRPSPGGPAWRAGGLRAGGGADGGGFARRLALLARTGRDRQSRRAAARAALVRDPRRALESRRSGAGACFPHRRRRPGSHLHRGPGRPRPAVLSAPDR